MQQLTPNRSSDRPVLQTGFQTFKKALGVSLIALSIYACISLLLYGIDTLNGGVNIQEMKIITQLIPKTSEARTVTISLPSSDGNTKLNSAIEIPEQMFLIPSLFLTIILLGILVRIILAILSAGVSLMKDDVSYVFEKLREEIERKKLPININEE